jgi:hypothetical protein
MARRRARWTLRRWIADRRQTVRPRGRRVALPSLDLSQLAPRPAARHVNAGGR